MNQWISDGEFRLITDRRAAAGLNDDAFTIKPAPPWLRRVLIGEVSAITLGRRIFVRPDMFGHPKLPELILHELTHVAQWRQMGVARFLGRYLTEYAKGRMSRLSHRDAYLAISLERQAREIANRSGRPTVG